MKVKDLLSVLLKEKKKTPLAMTGAGTEVSDLTADTRQVSKDSVFVAVRGTQFDAHTELAKVCEKEPAAMIVEDKLKVPAKYGGIVLQVPNTREALAHLASRYFQDPSLGLFCFGVTGTNGKTSCTYIVQHMLEKLNLPTGIIGTIEQRFGEKIWPSANTTPGPIELQSRLAEMKSLGARAVTMEVSSHALEQRRADGIQFNSVLFTNLTRDHLDYHNSMQSYFEAKQRLFTDLLWESRKAPQVAAVNADDPWARKLRIAFAAELFTYGTKADADFQFTPLDWGFQETKFKLNSPFGSLTTTIPLAGLHNLYNVMGCVAAVTALGMAPALSLRALETFQGVPGRLQPVANNRGISVFIDYAHSPDALENVLRSLSQVREQGKLNGQLSVVFGCGGDRDKGKRPLMAAVAEKWADQIIITNDNPRTEDPQAILTEIATGFSTSKPFRMIDDRAEAIRTALKHASAGDVVLIAGKGHEDYQIIGTEKKHFSDFETAREFFA